MTQKLKILPYLIQFLLTVLFYHVFFLFFLIIGLQYFIPAVITYTFNPTVELGKPIGIPTNKAKAKNELQSVVETKISQRIYFS